MATVRRDAWPYPRAPTVHDLAVSLKVVLDLAAHAIYPQIRRCFVCAEEDATRAKPAIGWVHPCKCTLVAHKECLLTWIDTAQSPEAREQRMKCASCGSPYHVTRMPSRLLGGLRIFDKAVNWASDRMILLSLGSGVASVAFSESHWFRRFDR